MPRMRAWSKRQWHRHGLKVGDAATAVLLIVILFPFFWLVQMSFRPNKDIFGYNILFTPTLDHYAALWTGNFPKSFINSILTSFCSTAFALIVGLPAAYALSRARFRSSRRIALWILATRMAPPIAFTIPFYLTYRYTGLHDTTFGLVLIYMTFSLALVIWMMKPFFDSVPFELEQAAYIDGCGVWRAFLLIAVPLAAPGIAATAVICFITAWNDFFFALILTRTNASTAPVAIVSFIQYSGWEWGRIAAAGTLVMLPVLVFSILVRNYLIKGLTAGGTKE